MNVQPRLKHIDGLRGVAAILVLLFHFEVSRYGCTGVDLFFIVSGFVIFMTLQYQNDLTQFWLARVIRLLPSYWLSIIIALVCGLIFGVTIKLNVGDLFGNVFIIQPIFRSKFLVGAYWTLYVEILFYFLVSLLMLMRLLPKIELVIFIGLLVCFALNFARQLLNDKSETFNHLFVVLRGLCPLVSHFHSFAAGILFYICYKGGFNMQRLGLIIFTFIVAIAAHKDSVMINSFINAFEHGLCLLVYYILFVLILFNRLNFLTNKLFLFFGSISYPLYLIHQPIGINLWQSLMHEIGRTGALVVSVLLCVFIATGITFLFDIPIRSRLKSCTHTVFHQ